MVKNRSFPSLSVVPALFVALTCWACSSPPTPVVCSDSIGCIEVGPDDPLKFGVLQALSGQVASLGQEQIRGTELALAGRHNKILGHAIILQTEDTGCSAEGGANAALKIIADPQTVAILGTTCSGAAVTASQVMSDAGLTMISGNNSAPFLTAIGGKRAPNWQPGYFRTAANEEVSGKAAALYAFEKLGVRKAATINDGDIYTRGLTDGFEQVFRQLGGDVVLSTAVDKGDEQMKPVLTAVLNSGAQLLFFPLFQPEGNHLLLQARETAGFEDIVLMSDGALIEETFIQAVGQKGKGLYLVGPAHPGGPAIDALAETYASTFKVSPLSGYYLNAFDAANLLFAAIERVAAQHPDGSLHIGRQALREALYAIRAFRGVTGQLSCDEFGDCCRPIFNILRLDDPAAGVEGLQTNVMYTYEPQP